MTLAPGSRFGAYEVGSLIGMGGMGEVYRATDTRLHRAVAIKVLPETFANDPDRIARFEREAQLLASLNHPHIAAIYGIERSDTVQALILELVEGATLADRIARGALPLDEALPIARQIAEALEAAHEHGVIHRDLKPANIKVREDGTVKVLDFGLAKAIAPDEGTSAGPANSPTITAGTRYGVILGTAAYMSPEQAKGKPADRRSDVWAFGCVLFEMLTGSRTFEGEDVSDTLASVLRAEPAWHLLPAETPEPIRRLIRRSLERDRRRRLADIGVARLEIDEALTTPSSSTPQSVVALLGVPPKPLWKRATPLLLTAIVAGALAAAAAWLLKPASAPIVTRARHILPADQPETNPRQWLGISRDGTRIVYVAGQQLYLRSLSEIDARAIPGTQNLQGYVSNPVFSADGASIAFFTLTGQGAGTIHKIAATGGTLEMVGRIRSTNFGLSWDGDDLLFGDGAQGIMRVSANGGQASPIITVGEGEQAAFPAMLPNRNGVIFTLLRRGAPNREETAEIVVQSLPSGERRTLVEGSDGRFVPTGHLVYAVGGTLFAVPFDQRRLEVIGGRTPILDGVRRSPLAEAHFSVSDTGTLVFAPGPGGLRPASARGFVLIDRLGRVESLKAPAGGYVTPRVSPNGRQLALGTDDGNDADVWTYELDETGPVRRLTFGGRNRFPIWSNDGQRLAFQSDREGDLGIFWQRADTPGTAERLTKPEKGVEHVPESWSPTGNAFLFSAIGNSGATLWIYSLQDRKARPVGDIRSSAMLNAEFSPDGRWIAYTTRELGMVGAAVFVEPFPPTGAKSQIASDATTHHPVWSPDGNELFYRVGSIQQVVVPVRRVPTFSFGRPVSLPGEYATMAFGGARNYDIMRDGKRFIIAAPFTGTDPGSAARREFQIVVNWFEELKQRVPARR
jgi:serine/threonine protein kinase